MPKIQSGASSGSFLIDGIPYPKGGYEVTVTNNKVQVSNRASGNVIVASTIFSDWTNASDTPYASVSALITAIDGLFFLTTNPSVNTITTTASLIPNISTYDAFLITAQAGPLTIANPSGSIGDFEGFVIRLTDNGTSRAITYGDKYRAFGAALPSATAIGKTIYLICVYNSADNKYDTVSREEL